MVCKECKNEFDGYKTRIFCSRNCYIKDWTRRIAGWNSQGKLNRNCKNCGKEFQVFVSKICARHPAIFCSKLCANRFNIRKGERHHAWRGGITSEENKLRRNKQYKLWRLSVFTKNNWTCTNCGAKSGNGKTIVLNADHILPFQDFPNHRLDLNNGRTLCEKCHYERTSKQLSRLRDIQKYEWYLYLQNIS